MTILETDKSKGKKNSDEKRKQYDHKDKLWAGNIGNYYAKRAHPLK